MKRLNFILGLTILVVAVTLALVILFKPRERGGSLSRGGGGVGRVTDRADADGNPVSAAPKVDPDRPSGVVVGVTAADPALMETAMAVEVAAQKRLVALTEQLRLTREQQAQIFPLLARSTPTYQDGLEIVGGDGGRGRLSPADAEAGIHDVLDLDQQAELIESIAEKDLWWADLMDRLEEDLVHSTERAGARDPAAGAAPEGAADGTVEGAAEGTVEPSAHRGGNLFELMKEEGR